MAKEQAIAKMRGVDWIALAMASVLVGVYCAGEIRDIKLVEFLLNQRITKSPTGASVGHVLFALNSTRQFGLLPLLTGAISNLVIYRGSDVMSICFNCLAALFVLEIDNAIFAYLLPDDTCVLVEQLGRATINEAEAMLLNAIKPTYTALTALSIMTCVILAKWLPAGAPFFAYAIGGAIETNKRKQSGVDNAWAMFLRAELTSLVCMGVIVGTMRLTGAVH